MRNIFIIFMAIFSFTSSTWACQENMVLKFNDGSTSCIDKTIFFNLDSILGGLISIKGELKKYYSMPLGVGANLVVAVPENIKSCSPVQVHAGTMWGRQINKSLAISKCESNSKSADGGKCNCGLIDELATNLTAEEFDIFQLDYAKAYAKDSNTLLSNLTQNTGLLKTLLANFNKQDINKLLTQGETFYSKKDDENPSVELILKNERQKLAEERANLDAEKAKLDQSKTVSRISVQAAATKPDADGGFVINIQTSADTASLMVDDDEQGANRTGIYSVRRFARVGMPNVITIIARDIFGNTDSKIVNVVRQTVDSRPTFARLNPASIKPQPPRDAVAIIIGIQNYKFLPKAEYANQDAQDFYDYASRALGIKQENIKLLLDDDADVSGIYKAFQNWLPLKVHKGKTDVYVFYSGHGLPSADGKSMYFLPAGADRDLVAKTAISQREIVDALKASQPKSVTMFIDSCYSGQIRTGETLLASARPVVMKVDEIAYPPDFTVITASASDQIALSSPDLKHGIFSYYLMKGLEGEADETRDGTITTGKLQRYLADRVPRFAMTMSRKQEPQLVGDSNRILMER